MKGFRRWSAAMEEALYGPGGFYRRELPRHHFATSAQAPVFAEALARFAAAVDERLGRPERFEIVDVGAGEGELVGHLAELLDDRAVLTAVELRPRPAGLPGRVRWRPTVPDGVVGLVVACELLDNVPCDVAVVDAEGRVRYEEVDGEGRTRLGDRVEGADADWLARWWPLRRVGERAEIGRGRERVWRELAGAVASGTALAIDYGHTSAARPAAGTLAGFRAGRGAAPVPDGTCDITAHVAVDALGCDRLVRQREALRELGLPVERPPLSLAYRDPTGYALELARASSSARLTDPGGLGAHWWMSSTTRDRPPALSWIIGVHQGGTARRGETSTSPRTQAEELRGAAGPGPRPPPSPDGGDVRRHRADAAQRHRLRHSGAAGGRVVRPDPAGGPQSGPLGRGVGRASGRGAHGRARP